MTLHEQRFQPFTDTPERRPGGFWSPLSEAARAPAAEALPANPYDEGFKAGLLAKTEEVEGALIALRDARERLEARNEALDIEYRRQCATTLAQIISAAAPAICEAAAHSSIAQIFDGAAARAELTLRASVDVADKIAELLPGAASYHLAPDADLAPGTIEAQWKDGGVNCDLGRSLFAIVEFLNSHSAPSLEEQTP